MGRGKDISNEKKLRITALLDTGEYSQRTIAKKEGVSRQTVQRIAALMKENIPTTSSGRAFCGKKRITNDRDDRRILKIAMENRLLSRKEITKIISEEGVKVSTRTVQRRLYEGGLKCRRPIKKPKLTPTMKKTRYEWAKRHEHLTINDWRKVR